MTSQSGQLPERTLDSEVDLQSLINKLTAIESSGFKSMRLQAMHISEASRYEFDTQKPHGSGKKLPLLNLSSFFFVNVKACENNTDSLAVGRSNLHLFNSSKEVP
jgi:hypothetical protein